MDAVWTQLIRYIKWAVNRIITEGVRRLCRLAKSVIAVCYGNPDSWRDDRAA